MGQNAKTNVSLRCHCCRSAAVSWLVPSPRPALGRAGSLSAWSVWLSCPVVDKDKFLRFEATASLKPRRDVEHPAGCRIPGWMSVLTESDGTACEQCCFRRSLKNG